LYILFLKHLFFSNLCVKKLLVFFSKFPSFGSQEQIKIIFLHKPAFGIRFAVYEPMGFCYYETKFQAGFFFYFCVHKTLIITPIIAKINKIKNKTRANLQRFLNCSHSYFSSKFSILRQFLVQLVCNASG